MGHFSMFKNRNNGLKAIGWMVALLVGILLVGQGCAPETAEDADASGFSAPTGITRKVNARVREELPFGEQGDFEEARR
jgi:alkyl sulfatase BDS1-like metallo-beta-lactamase superfamily hydrolase